MSIDGMSGTVIDGPIPWTAVDKYAQRTGLDPEDQNDEVLYDDLVYFIEQLDKVYLEYRAEQRNQSGNKSHLKPDTKW